MEIVLSLFVFKDQETMKTTVCFQILIELEKKNIWFILSDSMLFAIIDFAKCTDSNNGNY